jgi:hypothetical protein
MDDNKISLYNVKKSLQKDKKYQGLLESLLILTDSDNFRYLMDLGNHTKHRANVIPKLSYYLEFKNKKYINLLLRLLINIHKSQQSTS